MQNIFRYLDLHVRRRGSRVWQTDRQTERPLAIARSITALRSLKTVNCYLHGTAGSNWLSVGIRKSVLLHFCELLNFCRPADDRAFVGAEMLSMLFGHVVVLQGVFCSPSPHADDCVCCCCSPAQVIHHHVPCAFNRCEVKPPSPSCATPTTCIHDNRLLSTQFLRLDWRRYISRSLSDGCSFERRNVMNLALR